MTESMCCCLAEAAGVLSPEVLSPGVLSPACGCWIVAVMEPSPPDSGTSAPALHDGQGENASSGQKTTLAVQLPCGVGLLFKGEAYHFQGVNPSHCSVYWVLRWVMDFLGGNKSRNAVGQSAQTWRSRISDVLQCAHDEEQAAAHLLSSSWASLKRSDAAPDTAVAVDCLDFCVTTPGLLALLSHWAVRGPRANATWTLPTEEFMARCKALVAGVMGHMLYGEHSHQRGTSQSSPETEK